MLMIYLSPLVRARKKQGGGVGGRGGSNLILVLYQTLISGFSTTNCDRVVLSAVEPRLVDESRTRCVLFNFLNYSVNQLFSC